MPQEKGPLFGPFLWCLDQCVDGLTGLFRRKHS